ncbi:MAG: arylsulfatase A-like enzyme [Candidatus Binatia bacterium]|jgi:arylsulfatase A-like enzyme
MKNIRLSFLPLIACAASLAVVPSIAQVSGATSRPNIILVMADDQGWGQTGYYDHPILKTPNLDAMAANGLRFDRFYAGGPVCSPTRASVLTGRSHDRTGVYSHGYPLHLQEKTLPQALQMAGYSTAHFGKWHLNGLRGPGAPILASDTHSPTAFGYDEWLAVSNFFDRNPLLSREGKFEDHKGDSSEVVVDEALKHIKRRGDKPFFVSIWYGTPHSPFVASADDRAPFSKLNETSQNHYGELVAMDRSIGALRKGLRDMKLAKNTLVWFCSDNGGLKNFGPETVGGLRGFKGSIYEGGLRVPGIIEWPAGIKPRVTGYPAAVMDIFPTIAAVVGLPKDSMVKPIDGVSLKALFTKEIAKRKKPIPFRYNGKGALIDNDHKLIAENYAKGQFVLYDLANDFVESKDISGSKPELAARLRKKFESWSATVDASNAGKDFPGGKLAGHDPGRRFWKDAPEYKPYLEQLKKRPEYESQFKARKKKKQ